MFMRIATTGFVLLGLTLRAAFAQEVPDPRITDAEYDELIALIDESQDFVMGLITGMSDEQWDFRENPERWSTGECLEHIVRSEIAQVEQVSTVLAGEPDPEWATRAAGKTALIRQAVQNPLPQGQGGVRAPQEIAPTGEWGREDLIAKFYETHGKLRALVETMDRTIKDRTMESQIPQFGWMNGYDWLNLPPSHVIRHGKQIERIKADPNYPARPATKVGEGPDPNITDEEFAELVGEIDGAQDRLLGLISGMTDEQWKFQENPERWSTALCVEHMARTELAIVGGLEYSFSVPPNPNWYEETKGKYELVRQLALNRPKGGVGSPFRAGGEVVPTENWDRARGIEEFYKAHGTFRAYVETMSRQIKDRTFPNPFPEVGLLNGYDWLTLTAMHIFRHSLQIEEILADPNYPGSSAAASGGN